MRKQVFNDPFTPDFDLGSNADYLGVALSKFLTLKDKPQQFYDAINRLFRIQQRLKVVENVAKLSQLSQGFEHFKLAVNWLRKDVAITTGHQVAALNSYDEIDETNSQAFNQFVSWFEEAYLAGQETYLHAVFAFSATQIEAIEIIKNQASNIKSEITKTGNEKLDEIIAMGKTEKNKLSKFVALDEWAKHYDKLSKSTQKTLYGKVVDEEGGGKKSNQNQLERFINFINPKPLSKRLFYCWLFFALVIWIALSQDWTSIWDALSTRDFRAIGSEVFSHLWLFIFPSIFYSFTIKSYRIAKNQMAQNQQRATNARVLQNILEAKESISDDNMKQIVAFASESMFSIKNTGELSKKEIETGGAFGVAKLLFK
ncbi:hypothetical protein FWD20_03730 [Candidatus Saccharibacteria bacterium]|nr:hypothetical protein [Candidatus Saccharibacteria bacterium]